MGEVRHCHCFRSCLQLSASNWCTHVPSSVNGQLDLRNHALEHSIFDHGTRLREIVDALAHEPPTLAGCFRRDPKLRIGNLTEDFIHAFRAPLAMHLSWRPDWGNRLAPCQSLGSTLARVSVSSPHHQCRVCSLCTSHRPTKSQGGATSQPSTNASRLFAINTHLH